MKKCFALLLTLLLALGLTATAFAVVDRFLNCSHLA